MYWITESENLSRRTKIKKNENKNKQRVKTQHTYTTYTKQDTFSIYDIIETINEKKRKKTVAKSQWQQLYNNAFSHQNTLIDVW